MIQRFKCVSVNFNLSRYNSSDQLPRLNYFKNDSLTNETAPLMNQDRVVVNCTRSRVKTKSELTNLVKISRIEGYNGKYGSNPQGIREISDDLFEFDQIGR